MNTRPGTVKALNTNFLVYILLININNYKLNIDLKMLSDVKLKIRHAKRGNERSLDLSNMGLSDLPAELTQLTMLECLNVQNNKLQNLKRVEQLPNLKEIDASNNLITSLHKEMLDMFSIDSIKLYGNPIVNQNP